ncbi:ATP-binding protein [Actinoplanes lobatus]|nr:ATP-binding protein [Actinoplanes lobatus]MBB4753131.1 MoxR-like ATPase [Actinoplanes lobatus]
MSMPPSAGPGLDLLPVLARLDTLLMAAVDRAGATGRDGDAGRLPREPLLPPSPVTARGEPGPLLAWLAETFELTGFDVDVLVLAVASDLDLRYERVYAYLHDDSRRRRPTVDLALNLLCGSAAERIAARRRFAADAPLLAHRLVTVAGEPEPLPAHAIRADEQVLRLLIGESALDSRLAGCAELADGTPVAGHPLARFTGPAPRIYLRGAPGTGQAEAAGALAAGLGLPLLTVDLEQAANGPVPTGEVVRVALREAWFRRTALLLTGVQPAPAMSRAVAAARTPVVLSGTGSWWPEPPGDGVAVVPFASADRGHARSGRELSELAFRVPSTFGWDDLVLPPEPVRRLRELTQRVAHRRRVLDEWGFGRLLPYGRGVSALFTGPSGTGKTMAAGVIAAELDLDLYEIDLAGVVSKYIGETEKNLERIFAAAESAGAVLFFDEADAIFGKRSEVHDAHDRYANLEVAYLLRRMERYDGVAILATNLRENLDDAFLRRLQFVVEFPMPGQGDRERMWRRFLPDTAPVADTVDFDLLARRFRLSGGNIKNIVLSAAYLASANGGRIGMGHLIRATHDEHLKIGRMFDAGEHPVAG